MHRIPSPRRAELNSRNHDVHSAAQPGVAAPSRQRSYDPCPE